MSHVETPSYMRKIKCDGCGRRLPSDKAVVRGLYLYCPKCDRKRQSKHKEEAQ